MYTWSRKDVGSPKSTPLLSTFHIGLIFCFCPTHFMSSTYTDKNNPFSRCTIKHSQLETFSQPYFNRSFSNCPSHNSPAKRWPYSFRSRVGLPYWTTILATCVVVDESKCLDIPIWESSIILEHLPFWPGYKQILRPLLVLRTLAVWIRCPWLSLLSFEMLMILVQWILHKIQNHLSQCHLGAQLDLEILGALPPIRHSSNDRSPSVRQNEVFCPSSLLHRSPLIYFWLLSDPTPETFHVSPIIYPLLLLLRESAWLEA